MRQVCKFVAKQFPLPPNRYFVFGTSGFRTEGFLLPPVAARLTLLMVLRSITVHGIDATTVGIMVTASHNPAHDNGLKLIDHHGKGFPELYEPFAQELANAHRPEDIESILTRYLADHGSFIHFLDLTKARVRVAHDTRASGENIVAAILQTLCACGIVNYQSASLGRLTTPHFHLILSGALDTEIHKVDKGELNEELYRVIVSQYLLNNLLSVGYLCESLNPSPRRHVIVDCSNGVGFFQLAELKKQLETNPLFARINLTLHLLSTQVDDPNELNKNCGAEHAHKTRSFPVSVTSLASQLMRNDPQAIVHVYAIDGDADRIISGHLVKDERCNDTEQSSLCQMLDGDRILCLYAAAFQKILSSVEHAPPVSERILMVQTGYANGASTSYARDVLHSKVECVPTGVKYVHPAAQAAPWIGIYFESNGHGTAMASKAFFRKFHDTPCGRLLNIFSSVCGDAIANLLIMEVCLNILDWDTASWFRQYKDLLVINDGLRFPAESYHELRSKFKHISDSRLIEPKDLQVAIDDLMQETGGRAFIRPSGTEPIIRLYAEAETQEVLNYLHTKLKTLLKDFSK